MTEAKRAAYRERVASASPEVKALLRDWCAARREQLGPDWKRILAEKMTADTLPIITGFMDMATALKARP